MKKNIFLTFLSIILYSFTTNAQNKKVSIIVLDTNNKPVPGAVILFDNVRQKRWTNVKGEYKIVIVKEPKEISAFSPTVGIQKIQYNGETKVTISAFFSKKSSFSKLGQEIALYFILTFPFE